MARKSWRVWSLVVGLLWVCSCSWSLRPDALSPERLGELRRPEGNWLSQCAPDTARNLEAFEKALAAGHRSLLELCQQLGRPDWETGSGLAIYVYDLDDGSQVWLGYGGPQDLVYARLVKPNGQQVDLVPMRE